MVRMTSSLFGRQEAEPRGWRCHGRRLGAQACRLEHQKLTHLFLRRLGNEVERFCSPTAMKMDGGGGADNGDVAQSTLGSRGGHLGSNCGEATWRR
jgi:hypothetical protein